MDHLVLQTILLCMALCFSIHQGQELCEVLPTFLSISMDLPLQRLLVEWDVSDLAQKFQHVVFEIQVSRSDEMHVVWTEYYNTTLSKLNKTLHWSWDSELPLQCTSHAIRMRSLVNDEKVPEVWSCWSQWETVLGLDTSDDNTSYIFPEDKVVEEGSDVTFCCIGGKEKRIKHFFFNDTNYSHLASNTSQRSTVITMNKVAHVNRPFILALCEFSGNGTEEQRPTLLFVGKPPDEPKDLSCETRDMKTLTCTWNPGGNTYLYGDRSTKYYLYEGFSQQLLCSQQPLCYQEPISCSWRMDQQMMYNFTLIAQNPLGSRSVKFVLDVAQRVHPLPPSHISVELMRATEVNLYWTMQPKHIAIMMLCQIEYCHPSGQVELLNTSIVQSNSYPSFVLHDLQPYTNYAFRMRCGVAEHFWKWSEWSETLRVRTNEAAPSGKLDIWREVTPILGGRNVTLFWKPLPEFRPNGGNISVEITWEKLENASKSEHISISALQNSTTIAIDNHSYKISIAARNNINSSLPSVIIISQATDNGTKEKVDHADFREERVNGSSDGIYISWKATNEFDGYIVDWCNYPRSQPCDFQWKKFGFNSSSCLINSAAFMPGVRYSFRVYGSLANEAILLGKKFGYTKELAPRLNPQEEITVITPHTVTVTWDSYPTDESQPGFISGYHVYVKTKEEECTLKGSTKHVLSDGSVLCKYTIENPEEKRYVVKHLRPKTTYALAVKAYTGGGETSIDSYTHVDILDDPKTYFLGLLGILPLVLITVVCVWKSQWVKDCCCPEIPNPKKSKVLSFNGLKVNSEMVMKLSDSIPDTVVLENTSETNTLLLWSHETIPPERESQVTNPSWMHFVHHKDVDLTGTRSAPEHYILFENLAYSSQAERGSSFYQNRWMSGTSDSQLPTSLYQPQHYTEILSKDTVPSLKEVTDREDGVRYISQIPSSEANLSDLPYSTEPMKPSGYKIQTVLGSELVTLISDEDIHSEDSFTSSNSAVFLLPDGH